MPTIISVITIPIESPTIFQVKENIDKIAMPNKEQFWRILETFLS